MHVLKKLGLRGRRVSTKQDVDLASEATTACKLFADTAEQLGKDPFFDILVFPDARSKRVD